MKHGIRIDKLDALEIKDLRISSAFGYSGNYVLANDGFQISELCDVHIENGVMPDFRPSFADAMARARAFCEVADSITFREALSVYRQCRTGAAIFFRCSGEQVD
jgi:hypothetical protein